MIVKSIYDEKTLTERVWYDSSSVLYSEFIEHENDNNGELFVTFKNGGTYHYRNVDMVRDYVMFKNGGLDGSQGKALNQHIKPNYDFEKLPNRDVQLLMEEMEKVIDDRTAKQHTYFISGHRNITPEEFETYKVVIIDTLTADPEARFVIGDYHGVDIWAQNFLLDDLEVDPDRVTVYHMYSEPNCANPKVYKFKGGFNTDSERDSAMTAASSRDIAFVRDEKTMSGTAENILRRFRL